MTEINWVRLGKEIGQMPNGIAMLRVLQAHGVGHLVKFQPSGNVGDGPVKQSCSIDMVIDYAHRE